MKLYSWKYLLSGLAMGALGALNLWRSLRATAKAASAEEAEAMLAPVVKDVTNFLGDYVYGVDVSSLEEVCFHLLKDKGLFSGISFPLHESFRTFSAHKAFSLVSCI